MEMEVEWLTAFKGREARREGFQREEGDEGFK
jgi:hypothetical protein